MAESAAGAFTWKTRTASEMTIPSLHLRVRRGARGALLAAALAACGSPARDAAPHTDSASAVAGAAAGAPAAAVIDSALPPEEELRRFQADIPQVPVALAGGARSRDALGREFARALAGADSTALRRMLLTRAEFAYLVYPSSPYTRPPYRQPPWLVWMQLEQESEKGLRRLLARRAGEPLDYAGVSCAGEPESAGASRLWRQCVIRSVRAPGDTVAEQLFGVIVEHDGRFKLASYGNEL